MELMVQPVSCLQCILSRFPTMWRYNLDLWPSTLKNDRHLPLFTVINCTKLYDPGANGWFSILPTTFSYYVKYDRDLWLPTLKNNSRFLLSCWAYVSICKMLELKVWSTRPRQTDVRYTIIRPVKNGRIKYNFTVIKFLC